MRILRCHTCTWVTRVFHARESLANHRVEGKIHTDAVSNSQKIRKHVWSPCIESQIMSFRNYEVRISFNQKLTGSKKKVKFRHVIKKVTFATTSQMTDPDSINIELPDASSRIRYMWDVIWIYKAAEGTFCVVWWPFCQSVPQTTDLLELVLGKLDTEHESVPFRYRTLRVAVGSAINKKKP